MQPVFVLVSWGESTLQGLCHPPGVSQEQWVKGHLSFLPFSPGNLKVNWTQLIFIP